jgi:hypothetical protein
VLPKLSTAPPPWLIALIPPFKTCFVLYIHPYHPPHNYHPCRQIQNLFNWKMIPLYGVSFVAATMVRLEDLLVGVEICCLYWWIVHHAELDLFDCYKTSLMATFPTLFVLTSYLVLSPPSTNQESKRESVQLQWEKSSIVYLPS